MQLLKIIRHKDLFAPYVMESKEDIMIRKAARAVVFDGENRVALLKVTKHNYHKLPGGGVEAGEDLVKALAREVMEEVGCSIVVAREVGKIIEHRDKWLLRQESFCYLAKLVGEKGQPNFTEEETNEGFAIVWTSLDEAIEKLKQDQSDNYDGKFITERDLCFLQEVKKMK